MPAALPLLLASALGAGGSLDLGFRSEAGFRWVDPAPTAADARDLAPTFAPRAGLHLQDGGTTAELSYRPRLAVRDVGPDRRREAFHEGELRLRSEPGTPWRLELFGAGAVGRTDLVTLGRLAPPGEETGTITTTSSLDVQTIRAGASLRLAPSGRTEWLLSATGSTGGGADAASRVYLATEHAFTGEAQLGWSATRLDRLGLRLSAAASRFPDLDGSSAWANALATWRHRASRQVELSLGAGAVGFTSSFPGAGEDRVVSRNARPAAEAGVTASVGDSAASATFGARLGATNDRVTGRASQSLESSALLSWPANRWLALRLAGSGSVSWPVGGRIRRGGLEANATFRLARRVHLDVGGYGTWQRSENPIAPSLAEFGALAGISVDAPPVNW